MPRGDRWLLALGLGGMVLSCLWYFSSTHHTWPTQPIGRLSTEGTVKRRQSRSLSWADIRGGATIYFKDTVFTPPDARSRVVFFNNTEMVLEPNTMVRFSDVQTNQIGVALLRGNVSVVPPAGEARGGTPLVTVRQEETVSAPAETETPGTAGLALPEAVQRAARLKKLITQTLKRALPDLEGPVPLSEPFPDPTPYGMRLRDLRSRTVAALKAPRLKPVRTELLNRDTLKDLARISERSLAMFELTTVAPAKGATARPIKECVTLSWTPVPVRRVSYYLEISRDKRFRYVRSYGTRTNQIAIRLNDSANEYFWRVRAVYGSQSLVTPVVNFRVPRSQPVSADDLAQLPSWEVCPSH